MRKLICLFTIISLMSCSEEAKNPEPAKKGHKDQAPESISYRDSMVEIKSKGGNFQVAFPIFYSDQNHLATDSLIYFELSLNRLYGADVGDFLEEWERVNNGILGFEKAIFLNENGFFSAKISAQYDRVENDKYVNLNLSKSCPIILEQQLDADKKNEFYELLDVKTVDINTDDDPLDLSLDRMNFTFDHTSLYLHLHHPLSNKMDVVELKWDEFNFLLTKNSDFNKILSEKS